MGSNPPPPPGREYAGWNPQAGPTPEILPPQGYAPPPAPQFQAPPQRRRRSAWEVAPATHVLVAINCAVYLLMVMRHVSPVTPTTDSLFAWGADSASAILIDGQWWRIVTAMFVHGGILHLALNMWCLWNLGMLAEPLMGTFGVVATYILTGAAGNLLSTCKSFVWPIHEGGYIVYPVGVGASGAVFGIAGALIVLLKSNRLPVPPAELSRLRRSVIYFAVINLVIGLSISAGTSYFGSGISVDNSAHVGGCLTGLLLAVPMVPRIGSPKNSFVMRRRIGIGIVVGILVLFSFFMAQLRPQ